MRDLIYRAASAANEDGTEFVLSDETLDRHGEVISAAGWDLKLFKKNPVALLNHNANAIIGKWESVRVEGKRLLGKLVLAATGTSALVDEVRSLFEQKMIRAVSVGFLDIEKEKLDDDASEFWGPFRYLKQELLEVSLVAIPANPNAVPTGRSLFHLPAGAQAQLFGKPATKELRPTPAIPRVPAKATDPTRGPPMRLADKIAAAEAEIQRMRDALTAINDKDIATAQELEQADDLAERIPEAIAELDKLKLRERALTMQIETRAASPAAAADPARPFAAPARKVQPSDYLIRMAVVNFLQHVTHRTHDAILAERYPDEVTGVVVRAAVNPATTVFPPWAAELVETAVAEFINLLMPLSIYAPLSARGARFTFDRAGAIKLPARSATPTLAGAFVGEGAPIPVRRAGLTAVTLTPKKMGVISTFTRELAQHSTPSIEAVIRQAMAEDTAVAVDTILIDTNAATTIRPAGLRNGVAGLTPSAAAPNLAMVADLKALIGAITAVNGGRDVVVLINPAQGLALSFTQTTTGDFMFSGVGEAGQRLGVTFIQSTTVPAGMVIAVDSADFASATGDTPEFDVSDQATIHEEDTTPLPISATGTPNVVAAPVRSLWQTASLGVRMLLDMNWAMRRTGMVSWMENVVW
jgi:HK97 family phage prohead protease/HK97 family phage major capsid protein